MIVILIQTYGPATVENPKVASSLYVLEERNSATYSFPHFQ